jgi:regulator of replication initiation timing
LGRCQDHKTKIASERNEYVSQINELRKENDRLQSKLAKAEADAEHHKAHADKLWEASHKELSYEPEAAPEGVETVKRVGVALVDFNVFEASVSRLTAERDVALAEAEGLRADLQKAVTTAETLVSERDAAQKQMNEMHKRYSVLYNECENLRADLLAHTPDYAAQVECEKLRKDLQEITIALEVAEDEAQVLTERLAKEQKVVLELAEQNDLLTIELDSRRKAFLQMVVEMGKVSKEMLRT